ncbi:uncharacterized protein DNG_02935 [Cephalotrichum gorgonifer]|uniref:NB-ARC domain-containing protein n=1 Tax=Cephalotrichum gorgonifer TaxID=2041049 RepID=A0AAE8MVA9_9PEZI|nr:uncharacterized protein DNG_02935 [Cephalotrichum gorgonifer]
MGPHEGTRRNEQPSRPPIEVLYPVTADETARSIEVDIVAVHGLGANVDSSWTYKGGPRTVHWLRDRDMLPAIVPNARIMVYNYESKWQANAPRTRLELCGEELVNSLHSFRKDTRDRPIIFIGHSLGGLVITHALLFADRNEDLKYLPECTVGFAALGTPFRGTTMHRLADLVAWLMTPAGSHKGIVRDLKPDDQHLRDKVHIFCQLRERLAIPVCCLFELLESDYGKKAGLWGGMTRGMVVKEESAHIPGWPRYALQADHFTLNKFSGPDDRSFLTVSERIRVMCADSKNVIRKRQKNVQLDRNESFVGRGAVLDQLLGRIPPSKNRDSCQWTAIEGLGGIGKTQIALMAAFRVHDDYPDCSVFWVPATSATNFENSYREIGRQIAVDGIDKGNADIKTLVKTKLSQESAGDWLLIVDNADDTELLLGDNGIKAYLPSSRRGSILFTTRNHQVTTRLGIQKQGTIAITEMSRAESIDLLAQGLEENQMDDADGTDVLLDFLADLPLAIKQASAYMAEVRISTTKYLELCKASNETMIKLLSKDFEDRGRYEGIRNPIATTWLVSFEQILKSAPLAAEYLRFMCLLAQKAIPASLLPPREDELEVVDAIGTLKAYTFIAEQQERDIFDIHRLVRLAMQNWLREKGEWEEWVTKVIQRLAEEFPYPKHENRGIWMKYLPHAQNVIEYWDDTVDKEAAGELSYNMGEGYHRLGRYQDAEKRNRLTLELRLKVLGKEHPQTLTSMSNLARGLNRQGKYEESGRMHKETMELSEKVLGKEHPETLTSMENLARALTGQRKYKEAEKIYQQTLKILEKVRGKEHSQTLTVMNNLAHMFNEQGKYGEAERICKRTAKIFEEHLGKEHTRTLGSMNNLAYALRNQGKYEEAEKIFRQTLELKEKSLGKNHPSTLGGMNNLARALQSQGRHDEANQVLEERKKRESGE